MTFPKWYEKNSVKKLFSEEPREVGWEPCAGHYDFALGVWVDSLVEKHLGKPPKAPKGKKIELEALRAEYRRQKGKKPFMGWDAETLMEKLEG